MKKRPISHFFAKLGATLRNVRWSWGSHDPATNRVFLRVWQHEIRRVQDGEQVRVVWNNPNRTRRFLGFNERHEHLDLIRNGAQGFGVLCTAEDTDGDDVRIKDYDDATLLRLGVLTCEGEFVYVDVVEYMPVHKLTR